MEYSKRPTQMHASYRLSWVAYSRPALSFIVLTALTVGLFYWHAWAGALGLLLTLAVVAIQAAGIRCVLLYTDDYGVWVYRGILPWARGVTGVKWRDLEEAVYQTGFLSWALNAYTVRVGHRFTKTSEIVLQHVSKGQAAVEHINDLHRQVLAGRAGHYDEIGDYQAEGGSVRP